MLPIPKKILLPTLIALLVLVGGVLGYAIYQSRTQKSIQSTGTQGQVTGTDSSISAPAPRERTDLTDEEKQALNPPRPDASDERIQYAELISRLAQEADVLVVNNCEPSPVVMLVKAGGTIKVINENTLDHSIVIDPEHVYSVPAEGQAVIDTDEFGKGPGIYAYGCDLSNAAVGVFLLTEF